MKALFLILLAAQLNYNNAIDQAKQTNGSDYMIYLAMSEHGFKGDVNGTINMSAKVKALYINIFNQ